MLVTLRAMLLLFDRVSLAKRDASNIAVVLTWSSSSTAPNTPQDASTNAEQCLNSAPSGGVFTVTGAGSTQTATSTGSMGTASGTTTASPSGTSAGSSGGQNAAMSINPVQVGGLGAILAAVAFGVALI
jgi:hypothetical protein